MNTGRNTTSTTNPIPLRFRRRHGRTPLVILAALVLGPTAPARAGTQPAAIPFADIGAKATANYQGDALGVTPTADGARLRCGFQKLEGQATPEGLWLQSTKPGAAGRLRVTATALGRAGLSTLNPQPSTVLPATGTVSVADKLVRFTRPGLREEYSVSVDGVRQDFIIIASPLNPQPLASPKRSDGGSTLDQPAGDLRLELALSGARAEATASGVRLRLEGSGRVLAYGRLRVEDATGRELTARLEVLSPDQLAVNVADAQATYPVRIDPTFSDADWVSLSCALPGADGCPTAMAVDGSGNVYIGGNFTYVGTVLANNVARWDGHAWSALGSGMSSEVNALAVSGTNLYAAGFFGTAGGVPANFIAKWDGRAWSPLGSGMDGFVWALAVSGTNLYAGGDFRTAGGVPAHNIAKWDGSGWSALGSGINSNVYALAVSGTDLYAAGAFAMAGEVTANSIAKWNGSAWSALGSGIGPPGGYSWVATFVHALAVSGTDLYVGGCFTNAGGVPAQNIAKWDSRAWSALGSGIGPPGGYSWVNALAVSGTDLYAGGACDTAGGVMANNIAKWDGNAWSALGAGPCSYVFSLAVSGTNLYAGGEFDTAGGVTAKGMAKWDGSAWSAWDSGGIDFRVEALTVSGAVFYAGGLRGGGCVNSPVKWDGSAWSGLGPGIFDGIFALAVSGTDLYAGGQNQIAKWDGKAWSALGSGMGPAGGYSWVNALAMSGTTLYAGGYFATAGGVPANCIAKWNGSAWSALGTGMDGQVQALAVSGTNLYAGGFFTRAGGVPASNIAKWDGATWSALGAGINNEVHALAVSGSNLYAGGWFTTAGGVLVNGIAKWDGSAWSALGSGVGADVNALAVSGADLYAGGAFDTQGGAPGNYIARWDGRAWSPLGSGLNGWVCALALDGSGHLFVGGSFSRAGTSASYCIAQANVASLPAIILPPQTQTAEVGATVDLAVEAAGGVLTYQWFLNDTNALTGVITDSHLVLSDIQFAQAGAYTVIVTNVLGAVTSAPIVISVIPAVERRPVPGVRLTGASGSLLNVDYADALNHMPAWNPLRSASLTSPPQYCFDTSQPLPPQRFYRAWQTGTPDVKPSLDLHIVPAITLTGTNGRSVRLDYINQFGPIDAWVTLDTVTLTNTSQLYFDVSAPGQPQRLYRLVALP